MKQFFIMLVVWVTAGWTASAGWDVHQTVDSGGGRAQSSNYVADQNVGDIIGISTVALPTEIARHGYIGQLADVTGFSVQPETNAVDEGGSQTLGGVATLDDDTALRVDGSEVSWEASAFPLVAISASGLATTTNVYEDTLASVSGQYIGMSGTGGFLVRDVDGDNFDTYAGDGLPDSWQVGHFGVGNPDAGPTNNVDDDPFDNRNEWIADTIPTDSNSFLRILMISNAVPDMEVAFESSAARRYGLEATSNLASMIWWPIDGQTNIPGTGGLTWLTHTNVPDATHYRVTVAVP